MRELQFQVSDLVGRPGERRAVTGTMEVDLRVGESRVRGRVDAEATIEGIADGVRAMFRAKTRAHLVCTRCLTEWDADLDVSEQQVYEPVPDEDGYRLAGDDTIDLAGPVRDEIALAIPVRPLCQPDCQGLCPTCGTDLNRDPCGGHDEPVSSPFAALQGLFDSPDH
ncbi:MAG TPA: DUF177 domain-containing protein [Acidimicrobiia bacterium]|nr:DUF177 domain-containing protein [Acidimicrobiia bacterium]